MRKALRSMADRLYARRLSSQISPERLPAHIGILIDGNRRWAKSAGYQDPNDGHRAGGAKINTFLRWCDDAGIERVTIFMLSDDNLRRPPEQVAALNVVVEGVVEGLASEGNHWELTLIGALDVLPAEMAARLKEHAEATVGRTGGVGVNIAVGYGGQREIADAVRSAIAELIATGMSPDAVGDSFDADLISRHIYTANQPNVDLIIRTSGEQRLSGFLLWQSTYAEMYFCDAYWPDFRRIDFLRALRSYTHRDRRFGR
ncbi:isoprenyl transferase [Kribbella sp. NPDC056345]|uniref:isoprenyl transferase n=1 Tax=Kribbella sp. NPDC056345 TaxID=3345789 RepID=UPI0035DA2D9C